VALFIEAGDDRTRNKLQTTGETEQVPKLGRRTERDRQEVNMVDPTCATLDAFVFDEAAEEEPRALPGGPLPSSIASS
jgi:hypothetical protein